MARDGSFEGVGSTKRRVGAWPLSPLLFIARNPGKSLPIGLIILLSVALIAGIVALLDSIGLTVRTVYGYNRYFAAVVPRGARRLDPQLERTVRSAPGLHEVWDTRAAVMMVKTIVGKLPFAVIGLKEKDVPKALDRLGLRLGEGQLPSPGAAEIALSEPIVRNLHLRIGDTVLTPDDPDNYSPVPVTLTGILAGKEWFALTSYEFIQANYLLSVDSMALLARTSADQPRLDAWIWDTLKNTESRVWIYREIERETDDAFRTLNLIVNVCIAVLVCIIAIMMGLLANIYFTQRMVEFGLLQAIGFTRLQLLLRVSTETVLMVVVGWLVGLGFAYVGLLFAEKYLTLPRGLVLDTTSRRAYLSTVPVPVVICLFAILTIVWRLRKFDPVAIVERRLV